MAALYKSVFGPPQNTRLYLFTAVLTVGCEMELFPLLGPSPDSVFARPGHDVQFRRHWFPEDVGRQGRGGSYGSLPRPLNEPRRLAGDLLLRRSK